MTPGARPRRRRWRVAAAALALLVATLAWRGLTAVRELSAALRYEGEPTEAIVTVRALGGATARPLGGGAAVDLGSLERAVVFVFDPACSPTAGNMWNWVDVLGAPEARSVRRLAVTLNGMPGAVEYWRRLGGRVEVVAVDSATMRNRLRVDATPATLLLEDGAVRQVYAGPLNALAKQEVVAWLGRPPAAARKR